MQCEGVVTLVVNLPYIGASRPFLTQIITRLRQGKSPPSAKAKWVEGHLLGDAAPSPRVGVATAPKSRGSSCEASSQPTTIPLRSGMSGVRPPRRGQLGSSCEASSQPTTIPLRSGMSGVRPPRRGQRGSSCEASSQPTTIPLRSGMSGCSAILMSPFALTQPGRIRPHWTGLQPPR